MQHAGEIILNLCQEFQNELYVAILTIAALIVGVGLMLGEESAQKAKKRAPWVLVGAIIVGGAVTYAANYGAKFQF